MRPTIAATFLFMALLAGGAMAQESDSEEDVPPDSPDTVYSTGLLPTDPAVFAKLPHTALHRAFLPERVDLSKYFPTPGNQGSLGSCTAWAVGYAARSYYAVHDEKRARNERKDIPSPAFIYHSIRKEEDCSAGTAITDALALLQSGAVSLKDYPYSSKDCSRPTAERKRRATDFRIEGWKAVDYKVADNIKGQLAQGNPVVFGMVVGPKFEEYRGSSVYRAAADKPDGSHAMVIVGYDEKRQAFRIINSWGRGWGEKGFGWIDYDSLAAATHDAFVMDVGRRVVPEPPPDIAGLACAGLAEDRAGGKLVVRGFVGSEADLAKVKAAYAGKQAEFDVTVRPWPQCEILQTLDRQLAAANRPGIAVRGGQPVLKAGETLAIEVTAPDWPAYVYSSYVQSDGTVVTLSQPKLSPPRPQERGTKEIFGDGQQGRSLFTVSAPFGREMIVVVAARSPLFDTPLPATLTERDYLTRMRKAILYKPDPGQPDREVAAAVLSLETREK